MGKFVIVFKKKYPKFKLGDHINLIFKQGVDGGDTIRINGNTVALLTKFRNGAVLPVDYNQFTVGNKYVGEWTSKGLEIYAGEFVKEEAVDVTKKTLTIVERGTNNWYPCLFTQFEIKKQQRLTKNTQANTLANNTQYTFRIAKTDIDGRLLNVNTFAMVKYNNRVIPLLDTDKNYITVETLFAISNKNTTGTDVNYATISGTYKVYFSRGNKYLDGIEISVPSGTASHTRYRDYPTFDNGLDDQYKYYVTKSVFVKNRLYAIPASYVNTPDMHGNFNLANGKLKFVDKFGKNWTDSKNVTYSKISKLLVFNDDTNKLNVNKDFELCIPNKPNDGLFRTVSGDLTLTCLPSLYDFTTSINVNSESIIDPLKYINDIPYGVIYRSHMDDIDLAYVRKTKSNNSKANRYTEWLLPHFMSIYKIMDNIVNGTPYKFKPVMTYNGKNITQQEIDYSNYKTINVLARNKTPEECAVIVNKLAADIKKYKYRSIIRLINDSKVPYETIKTALDDADEYVIYNRESITKEESLLIKYLPASIANESSVVLDRLRSNTSDILFPNIKNLNDFGLVQDCLDIRPNHYFLYDLPESKIIDGDTLYTVRFNGPKIDGVKYYLTDDIANPKQTWTEITDSTKLNGLIGKTVVASYDNNDNSYKSFEATIKVKDKTYTISKATDTITPDGVIMYRIIPQSGVVINTNVILAENSGNYNWKLYVPGEKLKEFSNPYLLIRETTSIDGTHTEEQKIAITGDNNIIIPPLAIVKLVLEIGNYSVSGNVIVGDNGETDTINVIDGNTTWESSEYSITKPFERVTIPANINFDYLLKENEMKVDHKQTFTDESNLFDVYDVTKVGGDLQELSNESEYKLFFDKNLTDKTGLSIVAIKFKDRLIPVINNNREYLKTSNIKDYLNTNSTNKLAVTYEVFYDDPNIVIDAFKVDTNISDYNRTRISSENVFLVGCNGNEYRPRYKYFKGNIVIGGSYKENANPTPSNNDFFYKAKTNGTVDIDANNKIVNLSSRFYTDFTTPLMNASHCEMIVGKTDHNRIALTLFQDSPIIKCAVTESVNNCNSIPYDLYGIGQYNLFNAVNNTYGRIYMYRRQTMKDSMLWGYILLIDDYINAVKYTNLIDSRVSTNTDGRIEVARMTLNDGTTFNTKTQYVPEATRLVNAYNTGKYNYMKVHKTMSKQEVLSRIDAIKYTGPMIAYPSPQAGNMSERYGFGTMNYDYQAIGYITSAQLVAIPTSISSDVVIKLNTPAFKYILRRTDTPSDKTYIEHFKDTMTKLTDIQIDNRAMQVYLVDSDYVRNNISLQDLLEKSKPSWIDYNNTQSKQISLFLLDYHDLDDSGIAVTNSRDTAENMYREALAIKTNVDNGRYDANIHILEMVGGLTVWTTPPKGTMNDLFKNEDNITVVCGREGTKLPAGTNIYGIKETDINRIITDAITTDCIFKLSGDPRGIYKIPASNNSRPGANYSYKICYIEFESIERNKKCWIPLIDKTTYDYISCKLLSALTNQDIYIEVRRFIPEDPRIKYPIFGAVLLNTVTDIQRQVYNKVFYSDGSYDRGNNPNGSTTINYIIANNTVPGTNNNITSNTVLPDVLFRKNGNDDVSLVSEPKNGPGRFMYHTGDFVYNANISDALLAEESLAAGGANVKVLGNNVNEYNRVRIARNYGVNQINTFEPVMDNLSMRYTDDKGYKNVQDIGIGTFLHPYAYINTLLFNGNGDDCMAGTGRNTYIAVPEMFEPNLDLTSEPGSNEWKSKFSTKLYKNGVVYDFFMHSSDIMYALFFRDSWRGGLTKFANPNDEAHKTREGQYIYPDCNQATLIPHFKGIIHFYKQFLDDSVTVPTSISIGPSPVNLFVNRNSDTNHKQYVIYLDNIDDMNNNMNYITSFITRYYSKLNDNESVVFIVNNYAEANNDSKATYNRNGTNVDIKRASLRNINTYIARINKVLAQEFQKNPGYNLKIAVYFTNSRYQVMGPWSNEYLSSSANIIQASNPTGIEVERIANIIKAATGNTSMRNIFKGFNVTLDFLRKAEFMQAKNPKAYVGFVDPVIFETV